MLLASPLFDRIVGFSEEAGRTVLPVGCRRAAERRQVSRIAFGQRTQICRNQGNKAGAWETVMVRDISAKGIGFLCHEPIEPGATFMLKLSDQEGETVRVRCLVHRCERGGFGSVAYLLGASFVQVIAQQALHLNDELECLPDGESAEETSEGGQPSRGGVMTRAVRFFRTVDPMHWLRKADDFNL